VTLLLLPACMATAQAPAVSPQLSNTEKIAIAHVQEEFDIANKALVKARQDLQSLKDDFAIEHPGWHFDEVKGVVRDDANETPTLKDEQPKPKPGN
jgi:hypothetical protein